MISIQKSFGKPKNIKSAKCSIRTRAWDPGYMHDKHEKERCDWNFLISKNMEAYPDNIASHKFP